MTAEAGEGRQEDVMHFGTLCRNLQDKKQALQVNAALPSLESIPQDCVLAGSCHEVANT